MAWSLDHHGLQAELCLALLGYTGDVVREEEDEHGDVVFRVSPTVNWRAPALSESEREAVDRCVLPGALYASCRAYAEALCDTVGCVAVAVGRAAQRQLDAYAARVVAQEAEFLEANASGYVDGPSRLVARLGGWNEPLRALRATLERVLRSSDLRGGALVEFVRRRAAEAGAPGAFRVLHAVAAAATAVFLRQLAAWCTLGQLVDAHGEFFVRPSSGGSVWRGGPTADEDEDDDDEEDDGRGGKVYEVDGKLVPESMATPDVADKALFVGSATRLLRAAGGRRRGGDFRLLDDDPEAAALRELWAGLVELAAKEPGEPGLDGGNMADAIWKDAQLRRALADLVDRSERRVASKLKTLVVDEAQLGRALCAIAGVALLRCGPLWHRALELRAPASRTALRTSPRDDAAFVMQRALEDAARELRHDAADLSNDTAPGLAMGDAAAFVAAVDAVLESSCKYDRGRLFSHHGDADDASDEGRSDRHAVSVVADPDAFEWRAPRSDADVDARYEISGAAQWSAPKHAGDAQKRPLLELGEAATPERDDDFRAPRRPVESALAAKALRRVARQPWRARVAFLWSGGEDASFALCVTAARQLRVEVAYDIEARAFKLVAKRCDAESSRDMASSAFRQPRDAAALSIVVEHVCVDGQWRLVCAAYAQYDDDDGGETRADDARWREAAAAQNRSALAQLAVVIDLEDVLRGSSARVSCCVAAGAPRVSVLSMSFDRLDRSRRRDDASAAAGSIVARAREDDAGAVASAKEWRAALRVVAEPRWPLRFVLLDDVARDYDDCFRRLFSAKRASSDLDAAWPALARFSRANAFLGGHHVHRHACAFHHRVSLLSRGIATWLQRDVVEPRWRALRAALDRAESFSAIRDAHARFVLDLRAAMLLDDATADDAIEHVLLDAARLASLLETHADALDETPASALAQLADDFARHAAALFDMPQLAEPLAATADFSGWFHARPAQPGGRADL
ncbi:gamma-tubulin complex component protein [Pelagophyceae sp. CCMP2097]|nr:gamma-tubulin complex component protein [Pelagophyceae sp. CCMP2097]